MIVIGIDPGLTGGCAVWDGESMHCTLMFTVGKTVNTRKLYEWIIDLVGDEFDEADVNLFAIEKQFSKRIESEKGKITNHSNFGRQHAIAQLNEWPAQIVAPKDWKAKMLANTDKGKEAAIAYCNNRYPYIDLTPGKRRVPCDGMADAVCICDYARFHLV